MHVPFSFDFKYFYFFLFASHLFPKVALCCVISRVGNCAVLNLLEVMLSAVICMSLPWV